MRKMAMRSSGMYSGSFQLGNQEQLKSVGPAFETRYAIRESSPFISKYISLLRNTKDGGQKEEQFGTSENSISPQKTEGWPSLGVTQKTLS